MQGYILKIAYRGGGFCGWQVQPGKRTVQATLQSACERIFGAKPDITGCSRTDSGVHARGFVALCSFGRGGSPADIPLQSVPQALNSALPDDCAVVDAAAAPNGFHPRYDAAGKEYVYTLLNSRLRDPFYEQTAWHFPRALDVSRLNALCARFVGTRDFRAFMAAGSKINDTVRTVRVFRAEGEGGLIRFTAEADGFLYNMVRIMVGTAAEFCANGASESDIDEVIESRERARAGITAPAKGLCLNRVIYPRDLFEKTANCI